MCIWFVPLGSQSMPFSAFSLFPIGHKEHFSLMLIVSSFFSMTGEIKPKLLYKSFNVFSSILPLMAFGCLNFFMEFFILSPLCICNQIYNFRMVFEKFF